MNYNILISNLNTFNNISVNDKITIKKNIIYFDKCKLLRPIIRYINNQNRELTYLFVYKSLIQQILLEIKKYKFFIRGKSKFQQKDLNIQNVNDYKKMSKKFIQIKKSLNIMKKTYYKDINYIKKIDLLIIEIQISQKEWLTEN